MTRVGTSVAALFGEALAAKPASSEIRTDVRHGRTTAYPYRFETWALDGGRTLERQHFGVLGSQKNVELITVVEPDGSELHYDAIDGRIVAFTRCPPAT